MIQDMTGSITILAFCVAGVAGSIFLDKMLWHLEMSWPMGFVLYTGMIFTLLWLLFLKLGVL